MISNTSLSNKKHDLTISEINKVVEWLMDDDLLDESKHGPVTEHGTRYRLMNNYNHYYVEKLDSKVMLTKRTRARVQKAVREAIDKKYGPLPHETNCNCGEGKCLEKWDANEHPVINDIEEWLAQIRKSAAKQVRYSCIKLNHDSSLRLSRWVDMHMDELFSKVECHHMTIKYGEQFLDNIPSLGEEVVLTVVGYAKNKDIQAVVVETNLECDNGISHITISRKPDVDPKLSNELLENGYLPVSGPTLRGVVGYYKTTATNTNFYTQI